MNPYELLLELRENKILFSYMETSAVYVEDNDWSIIGDGASGELRINITCSNTLRLGIPLAIPTGLPLNILDSALSKLEFGLDGLLKGETDSTFGGLTLYYYIHVGMHQYKEDLNKALLRFLQDKRLIDKTLSDISKTINSFKKSAPANLNSNTSPDSTIWDDIDKLDKNFTQEDSEETDDDIDD